MNDKKLLEVKDLHVSFFTPVGEVKAVGGISYDLGYNEVMGIVGESGSGKSVEAYSIIGLLQSPGKVTGGEVLFEGRNVLEFSNKEMQSFRGNEISMIFQNPMTCLNPVYTVGDQLIEAVCCHETIGKDEAKRRALEMLTMVGINNVEQRFNQYPQEPTGSNKQRVVVSGRFGLDNDDPPTLVELDGEIGVTREGVRPIQQEALVKLKRALTARGVGKDALL